MARVSRVHPLDAPEDARAVFSELEERVLVKVAFGLQNHERLSAGTCREVPFEKRPGPRWKAIGGLASGG